MQFKHLLYCLFLSLLWSCTAQVESPYPNIEFVEKAKLPVGGRASAVAFAIGDNGYVTLGRDSVGNVLNDSWKYNPANNSWIEVAPFPDSARVKAVAAVVNGKAYVGLGFYPAKANGMDNGSGMLKGFWMYNPETNTWTQKASFPSIATDACVSFVVGNDIFVGGGFNGLSFTGEFWKYNTLSDEWRQLRDFPGIWRAGSVCCSDSSHIYFGTGYRTINQQDWWEYSPQTDSWKTMEYMPDNGRENGVGLTINGRYFVSTGRHFGGNLTGGAVKSDIYEYDAIRNCWYARGNIPASGRENAISFTIAGKGYIGFGENDSKVLNDFWAFEP